MLSSPIGLSVKGETAFTIVYVAIGILLSIIFAKLTSPAVLNESSDTILHDPSYKPRASRKCTPPPTIDQEYPVTRTCIHLIKSTPTELTFKISLPRTRPNSSARSFLAHLVPQIGGQAVAEGTLESKSNQFIYNATNLSAGRDYTLQVYQLFETNPTRVHICTGRISTQAHEENLVQNPSFEDAAEAPYLATQQSGDKRNARQWTPFYNGGARRKCSFVHVSNDTVVGPRSGQCLLLLGRVISDWHWSLSRMHFGAHHAVSLPNASEVVISVWYTYFPVLGQEHDVSNSFASLVVSWVFSDGGLSDGVSVTLDQKKEWTPVCVHVPAPPDKALRMVHIFFHNDEAEEKKGNIFASNVLLIDDVAAWEPNSNSIIPQYCYQSPIPPTANIAKPATSPPVHLRAIKRVATNTLTIGVPMTADRILRLEMLSKQFGGGAIAAAVVVRNEQEMKSFASSWNRKLWLRNHVDIAFVRLCNESQALAINALRNVAMALTNTTFVVMLDVDMTPAPFSFDCLRQGDGNFLTDLLPSGKKRLIATTVYMMDTHQRATRDKDELRNAVLQRAGMAYCINSQKGSRLKTWFKNDFTRMTRFRRDYEPYAIGRRINYPKFDERFSGYGFNKISWLHGAEARGWEISVLGNVFVTHLNHVENSWVSGINETHYLTIWRRYLGMTAELNDFTNLIQDL